MATPTPASRLPTRQQLDEIDALLQRMLALPPTGNEPTDVAPAAPRTQPAEMTFPAPVIREVPPVRAPAPDEPVVREWRVQWPQSPAPQSSAVADWGAPVPLATPVEEAESVRPSVYPAPAPVAHIPVPVAEAVVDPPAAPVHVLLWPLILLNLAFIALTHLLPFGVWLRGRGRTTLGWVGIGLIVTTTVWAAGEWLGYEWPRPNLSKVNASKLGL
jgi:hypothetical protein